ncbi:hypothetical protein SXCC_00947 [Gluconacetobacter sp. SXCC-1]|nr:hypothetical protein SXCC_00947 [Gluconacetobacter sp. SXCC-1]
MRNLSFNRVGRAIARTGPVWESMDGPSAKTPAHDAWQTCFLRRVTGQKSSIRQENVPRGTTCITIR